VCGGSGGAEAGCGIGLGAGEGKRYCGVFPTDDPEKLLACALIWGGPLGIRESGIVVGMCERWFSGG
jgi:hypothetical protein